MATTSSSSGCDFLSGKMNKSDGSTVEFSSAVEGKSLVALYFSAHWCPPCRGFTPKLKAAYEEGLSKSLEIVFISSDRSADDQASYFKEDHGDWLAVPFGDARVAAAKKKFGVTGIPTLIVLDLASGKTIDAGARGTLMEKGPGALEVWLSS